MKIVLGRIAEIIEMIVFSIQFQFYRKDFRGIKQKANDSENEEKLKNTFIKQYFQQNKDKVNESRKQYEKNRTD